MALFHSRHWSFPQPPDLPWTQAWLFPQNISLSAAELAMDLWSRIESPTAHHLTRRKTWVRKSLIQESSTSHKSFPPPPPQCIVVPLFELPAPQLWMEGRGEGCGLRSYPIWGPCSNNFVAYCKAPVNDGQTFFSRPENDTLRSCCQLSPRIVATISQHRTIRHSKNRETGPKFSAPEFQRLLSSLV